MLPNLDGTRVWSSEEDGTCPLDRGSKKKRSFLVPHVERSELNPLDLRRRSADNRTLSSPFGAIHRDLLGGVQSAGASPGQSRSPSAAPDAHFSPAGGMSCGKPIPSSGSRSPPAVDTPRKGSRSPSIGGGGTIIRSPGDLFRKRSLGDEVGECVVSGRGVCVRRPEGIDTNTSNDVKAPLPSPSSISANASPEHSPKEPPQAWESARPTFDSVPCGAMDSGSSNPTSPQSTQASNGSKSLWERRKDCRLVVQTEPDSAANDGKQVHDSRHHRPSARRASPPALSGLSIAFPLKERRVQSHQDMRVLEATADTASSDSSEHDADGDALDRMMCRAGTQPSAQRTSSELARSSRPRRTAENPRSKLEEPRCISAEEPGQRSRTKLGVPMPPSMPRSQASPRPSQRLPSKQSLAGDLAEHVAIAEASHFLRATTAPTPVPPSQEAVPFVRTTSAPTPAPLPAGSSCASQLAMMQDAAQSSSRACVSAPTPSRPSPRHRRDEILKDGVHIEARPRRRNSFYVQQVGHWEFDALGTEAHCCNVLQRVGSALMNVFDCVNRESVANLLRQLEGRYHGNNPYHSHVHAADMCNSFQFLAQTIGIWNIASFSPYLRAMSLLAALGHDVGHPARTNVFLVRTEHEYITLYGEQSVLEHMHAASLMRLLDSCANDTDGGKVDPSSASTDICLFPTLTKKELARGRKLMIMLILNTDASKHLEALGTLRKRLQGQVEVTDAGERRTLDPVANEDDHQQCLSMLFRAADLGHSAKRWELHELWTKRITQEFHAQGDEEKRLGMSVSPLCEREGFNLAREQVLFLQFVCVPTWIELTNLEGYMHRTVGQALWATASSAVRAEINADKAEDEKTTQSSQVWDNVLRSSTRKSTAAEFSNNGRVLVLDELCYRQCENNRQKWKDLDQSTTEATSPHKST